MPIETELTETFTALGPTQVRTMLLNGTIAPTYWPAANRWLAQRDEEERLLKEASQASQMRTALSANRAAWIAAIAAISAAVAAIIGAIITYLAWFFPHAPGH